MIRAIIILAIAVSLMASCRSTRKIQTAIAKKDSMQVITPTLISGEDSAAFIRQTFDKMQAATIDFTTFSAKINVDYQGTDGKKYDVNANLRMYKDSVIWISITAIFGIEGLRAYITKDSVKILNKQDCQLKCFAMSGDQAATLLLPADKPHSLLNIFCPVYLRQQL